MRRYLELFESGELSLRVEAAKLRLAECDLCPRVCGVDRGTNEAGVCGVGGKARVASANLHFGEESPLVGRGGSGTIFFAGCNLNCHFCQNYDISHEVSRAREVTPRQLAEIMVCLQRRGAHNINFVTPSHVVPQILEALPLAIADGLNLPLVYNTSAYDSVETLRLLDGVIDIYMPDVKVWSEEQAERFCSAHDYPAAARAALVEMHHQVGDLAVDRDGVATMGMLVRHLVMPHGAAGTKEWMVFLAAELSRNTYVNIMGQYHPCGRVLARPEEFPELSRRVTSREMEQAFRDAADAGISRFDQRRSRAVDLFRLLTGD